jgi:hypothetical protein
MPETEANSSPITIGGPNAIVASWLRGCRYGLASFADNSFVRADHRRFEQFGLLQPAHLGGDGLVGLAGPVGDLVDRPPARWVAKHERKQLTLELRSKDQQEGRGAARTLPYRSIFEQYQLEMERLGAW